VGWISKERRKSPAPAGADERLRAHRISKSLIAGHLWLSKTRISDALRHAALKEQRKIYLTALLSSNGRGARTVVKRTEEQGASITAAYTEHSVAREESMRDCMTHGYYRFAQCSLIDTCVLLIPFAPPPISPCRVDDSPGTLCSSSATEGIVGGGRFSSPGLIPQSRVNVF
jgi:hypothetical protein